MYSMVTIGEKLEIDIYLSPIQANTGKLDWTLSKKPIKKTCIPSGILPDHELFLVFSQLFPPSVLQPLASPLIPTSGLHSTIFVNHPQ